MRTKLLAILLSIPFAANADVISIDFDTAATGSDILNGPLATAAGNVTASASSGSLQLREFPGGSGDGLAHRQTNNSGYGQLAFDFDVSSITFLFAGFTAGDFLATVLDINFNVLDTFFDDNTSNDLPGGPVTLAGSGIRYFRFEDSPSSGRLAGVDSLQVTAATRVPEPSTLALLGLGLMGIGLRRRRQRI